MSDLVFMYFSRDKDIIVLLLDCYNFLKHFIRESGFV